MLGLALHRLKRNMDAAQAFQAAEREAQGTRKGHAELARLYAMVNSRERALKHAREAKKSALPMEKPKLLELIRKLEEKKY